MSKILKRHMAQELRQEFEPVKSFMVFRFDKLNAQITHEFRKGLFEQNIKMVVVKNTLFTTACKDFYPETIKALLKGPTAVVYGGESIVSVAKALVDWKKKNQDIEIKGGYIPGKVLGEQDVESLSKVPPREVLLSMLAGAFEAPLQQIATIMAAPMQDTSYAISGVIEKMEENALEKVEDAVAKG